MAKGQLAALRARHYDCGAAGLGASDCGCGAAEYRGVGPVAGGGDGVVDVGEAVPPLRSKSSLATGLGCVAIVLWGTTIPISRHLTEQMGTFTAAACVYLTAGMMGCVPLLWASRRRALGQLSRRYLLVCGLLVVVYTVLLYAALDLAHEWRARPGVN